VIPLRKKEKEMSEELRKLHLSHSKLQTRSQADRQVIQQVERVAAGKPYLLQCVFGSKGFVELTQLWRSAKVFADLPKSAVDAGLHFGQLEGHEVEKAFWSQFQEST
jgi:hypothetical protein